MGHLLRTTACAHGRTIPLFYGGNDRKRVSFSLCFQTLSPASFALPSSLVFPSGICWHGPDTVSISTVQAGIAWLMNLLLERGLTVDQLLERAQTWVRDSKPDAEEVLLAHNNLAKRVLRGAIQHEESHAVLEFLAETFIEADGDMMLLMSVEPEQAVPAALAVAAFDAAPLVAYDDQAGSTMLTGDEKRNAFDKLKSMLGVRDVAAVGN